MLITGDAHDLLGRCCSGVPRVDHNGDRQSRYGRGFKDSSLPRIHVSFDLIKQFPVRSAPREVDRLDDVDDDDFIAVAEQIAGRPQRDEAVLWIAVCAENFHQQPPFCTSSIG